MSIDKAWRCVRLTKRLIHLYGFRKREFCRECVMKFEIYADSGGNYRWRLVSSNGQTIATSGESFSSKSNATRAAENIRDNAGSATVVDA